MSGFKNLLPKLLGFIVIVITLALAPSIYTANLLVVNYASVSSGVAGAAGTGLIHFLGMAAITPFGGFLIILGLLVTQGMFAIGSMKESSSSGGWKDMFAMVGIVILTIILLNVFVSAVMPAFNTLIAAATAASDTIGETVFGVFPIIIYLGIVLAGSGFNTAKEIVRRKGSRKSSNSSYQYA